MSEIYRIFRQGQDKKLYLFCFICNIYCLVILFGVNRMGKGMSELNGNLAIIASSLVEICYTVPAITAGVVTAGAGPQRL